MEVIRMPQKEAWQHYVRQAREAYNQNEIECPH